MGAVATRAKVAKATVYRRWSSREDLVADALESIMLSPAPDEEATAATLRDDLIATLARSSGCLEPQGRRFTALLAATAASHPQITDTLRERYIAAQRQGIAACLQRGQGRGEIAADTVERLLSPGRLEIDAVIAVLLQQEALLGAVLDAEGVARLVDQVLLPLISTHTT
ncbi:TetR family transcriptional regulator [Lentzea pudingi]|uniref:TetR family transcriptional regulator n=2 Tax=Lentzea pudingi TaxID=1789439 RepID=A0ABQ2HRV4_9PSEU|nr:TetR family transcriptional regulator [Lentzea pudingi]